MKNTPNQIDIFWTGGLDSTFRLVQLLLQTDNPVQPHYIVRHEDSTGIEIDTMIQLRRSLVRKYPEIRSRFLPTVYVNEDLIPKFKEIDEEIEELSRQGHVKEQYHIMSHYCKAFNIKQIEVALEGTGDIDYDEKKFFFKNSDSFKCFTYPTLQLTKFEMFNQAKNEKWDDILLMTSFCRRPSRKKIAPCGVCGPCVDAVSAGMGFRLPFKSRVKAYIQIPFRKFWRNNYARHDKPFFKFIRNKFEGKF